MKKERKATTNKVDIEKEHPVTKLRAAINVLGTKTFCNKFSRVRKYISQ